MKKVALILSGLFLSATAFAHSEAVNKGYYSSLQLKGSHSLQAALTSKAALHPPTNITVVNGSSNSIYVNVPNTPINDLDYPEENDHVYNALGAFNTDLILRDPHYRVFFNAVVCPFAIVAVYGHPGAYRVKIDNDLC